MSRTNVPEVGQKKNLAQSIQIKKWPIFNMTTGRREADYIHSLIIYGINSSDYIQGVRIEGVETLL